MFARRRYLKAGSAGVLLILAGLFLLPGSGSARASTESSRGSMVALASTTADDELHWTFSGPGSVTLDWRGPDREVRYGPTIGYGLVAQADAPNPLPFSSDGPFWEAKITGLQDGTSYHYSIGGGPDHQFRTLPVRGSSDGFTVYAEGDIGDSTSYSRMPQVQSLIVGADFVIPVGDLDYANAHGQAHVDSFFDDIMVWSQDAGTMPVWGNHEWDNPTNSCGLTCGASCGTQVCDDLRNYKGRFELPNPQASVGAPAISCCGEDWYWFDYGKVRFIAYPEPWSGAWSEWSTKAAALMDQAQSDPAISFIVTIGHRPAYSSGHHPGASALRADLDALGAGHTKYVLNLNGHSHNYERTTPRNGVIHVTVGTGGGNMEQDGSCLWLTCTQPSWSAFRAFTLGALRLKFGGGRIDGEFLCGPPGGGTNEIDGVRTTCVPGTVVDSFAIQGAIGVQAPQGTIDSPAADTTIVAGQSVLFAGTGADPGGNAPLSYAWDFGGGALNQNVEDPGNVVFDNPGFYTVSLTVTNSLGLSDATPDARVIIVGPAANQAPDGKIDVPAGDVTIDEGESVYFSGSGIDPDGNLPLSYFWDLGGVVTSQTVPVPGSVIFSEPGTYVVTLTVSDSLDLVDPTPDSRVITVRPISNLVGNPSFENDTSGWTARSGSTIQRVPGGYDGLWSLMVSGSSTLSTDGLNDSPDWLASTPRAGLHYRLSAWVRSDTSLGPVRLRVREYLAGVLVGAITYSPSLQLTPIWQQISVDYVTAGAGSTLDLAVMGYPVAPNESFVIDDIVLREVP